MDRDFFHFSQKLFDEEGFKAMSKEVRSEVRASIKWADASPPPDVTEELYKDVYVEQWGPYNGTSEPEMLTDGDQDKEGG